MLSRILVAGGIVLASHVRADITVSARAEVVTKPDAVVVTLVLSVKDIEFPRLHQKAASKVEALTADLQTYDFITRLETGSGKFIEDLGFSQGGAPDEVLFTRDYWVRVYAKPDEDRILEIVQLAKSKGFRLAGANPFEEEGAVMYMLVDGNNALDKAFREAIDAARRKANVIARATGLSVGRVSDVVLGEDYDDYGGYVGQRDRFVSTDPVGVKVIVSGTVTFETE